MDFQNDDISMNTIIEAGSSVKGDIYSAGLMKVNGDVDGNIECAGRVIIGAKARIRADIIAESVIVCGVVNGDIVAPSGVHIYSDAIVLGDIVTKHLQVDDDVVLHGKCISLSSEDTFEGAKKRWIDEKAIKGKTFSVHSE